MAKFVVFSGPVSAEREDEYNQWYDEVHLAEVCTLPGIVAAQRFVSPEPPRYAAPPNKYLAVYEFEGNTDEILDAMVGADFNMSDAIDLENTHAFVMEEHGERYVP